MTTFEETLELIRRNNEGGDVSDSEVQAAIEEHNRYDEFSGDDIAGAISRSSVGVDTYASLRQSLDEGTPAEFGISPTTRDELRFNTSGASTMSELSEEIEAGRLSAADAVELGAEATGESRQEIDAALGLAEAPDEPDYRQQRRDLREAAREQIRADPSLDIDNWTVDARAGELGDGRKMIILQDPETNRTRTIPLDESAVANPGSAAPDLDEQAEAIDWDSGEAEAPTPTQSGSGFGAVKLAAIAAIVAAVGYGVTQL